MESGGQRPRYSQRREPRLRLPRGGKTSWLGSSVRSTPEEEWDRVLDINLKGTLLCMKYEARAMLAGGHGGAIVNVGSINSFLGFPTGTTLSSDGGFALTI